MKRDEDYTAAAVADINGLRVGLIGLTTNIDTRVGQQMTRLLQWTAR